MGHALNVNGVLNVAGVTYPAGGINTAGACYFPWSAYANGYRIVNLGDIASSFGGNGYYIMPSGCILQWGNNVTPAGGAVWTTFPVAFPSYCLGLTVTPNSGSYYPIVLQTHLATNSRSNFWVGTMYSTTGAAIGCGFNWMAIGY
jgi:hypothetical protein